MEKRWGLDLDMSAVRLMRRDDGVWAEIAVEKIDSPDIEDRLSAMIGQIESGAAVELFLPREQILYAQVEFGPEGDTRAQIERAMDGRTPYQLDELSLDWELTASGSARVAAIAYETLDEAAAFAEVRGLSVSGYSSLASADDFPRAPAFDGPNIVQPASTEETGFAIPVETAEELEAGAEEPAGDEPLTEPDADPDPVAETEVSAEAVDAVAFTSARKPSRPPHALETPAETPPPVTPTPEPDIPPSVEAPAPLELANPVMPSSAPVVHVDDATPVMSVKNPVQPPLDPGTPISGPTATPRIRTDIAASTVSGSAASLTPPGGSVKMRRSGSFATTAMIFAVVFLATVGIATLVWTLLPMSPTGSQQAVPSAPQPDDSATLAAPETDVATAPTVVEPIEDPIDPEPEIAAVAPPEEDREVVAPQEELDVAEDPTPEVPDAPQPSAQESIANLLAPDVGSAPILGAILETVSKNDAPQIAAAVPSGETLPAYDANTPFPETPAQLARISVAAPVPGPQPVINDSTDDIYIASIETSDLASDAIALPSVFGLQAGTLPQVLTSPDVVEDEPEVANVPEVAGTEDAPTPDVALLGDVDKLEPSQENDDAMAAAVAQALADALAGPAGLVPTKLASAIPDLGPKARPGGFVEDIERNQFGGRTRSELSGFRPPPRPASVQSAAAEDLAPPSEQAIELSLAPRGRPANFGALVSAALVQREAERLSASVNTRAPDTSSAVEAALDTGTATRQTQRLNIPSSASVARQATIENAIPLNKVNLVGVYGGKSNRRALVRLSSGRYVKVQVGDRVDGGTVAQITDSELLYRKGNRTLSLSMPQG